MTYTGADLLNLLPTVYRLRDREHVTLSGPSLNPTEAAELAALEAQSSTLDAEGWRRLEALRERAARGPLGALLEVLGRELQVVADDLDQLYDDEFVETAARWALPYLGDLIGYRALHGRTPGLSERSQIGHTIAFRRRKGTASMLEQLARDVTGWQAHAVESFALLATAQFMNHPRLGNVVTPTVRFGGPLELIGTAFDPIPRTLDVRSIDAGRGRHNIPNIGVFLWRLRALATDRSPAVPDPLDPSGRRFRFSPLGNDIALVNRPQREEEIEHLAEPANVPFPITRRRLADDLRQAIPDLYSPSASLCIFVGGVLWPSSAVAACNFSDVPGGWAHEPPAGTIGVDPELGRIVVAAGIALGGPLSVMFHEAGPGGIGGGDYDRAASFTTTISGPTARVPSGFASVQAAIDSVTAQGGGIVEIQDSGRYAEALSIDLPAEVSIAIRAANGLRPSIELPAPWTIRGDAGSRVFLNGLLVIGDRLVVRGPTNKLSELHLDHCTLVPGFRIAPDRTPLSPGASSVRVSVPGVSVSACTSILGSMRIHPASRARVDGCVVDAGRTGIAFGASDTTPTEGGGPLDVESATFIGAVYTERVSASNAIHLGRVVATRKQDGCVRFSSLGPQSATPRQYRCQPALGPGTLQVPHFASLEFGAAAYARLADGTPAGIASGAEDESEMGVFRRRYEPQRHADLRTRLDEYLRVGLEAGVIHES
jgi:hypothetical protein